MRPLSIMAFMAIEKSPSTFNAFVRGGPPAPHVRGLQHLVALFLTLIVGPFLVYSAKDKVAKAALALSMIQTVFLFLVSAMGHTHCWMSTKIYDRVFRVDHANVLLAVVTSWVALIACKGFDKTVWHCMAIWVAVYIIAMMYKVIGIVPKTMSFAIWSLLVPLMVRTTFSINFNFDEIVILSSAVAWSVAGLFCFCLEYPKMYPKVYGHHDLFHSITLISQALFALALYRASALK